MQIIVGDYVRIMILITMRFIIIISLGTLTRHGIREMMIGIMVLKEIIGMITMGLMVTLMVSEILHIL